MSQYGLFPNMSGQVGGPENVRIADEKQSARLTELALLAETLEFKPSSVHDTRLACLRGFLGLHFTENPDELLKRPLLSLGGKSLLELIDSDYDLAYAWMQEYRKHRDEKPFLVAEFEGKK